MQALADENVAGWPPLTENQRHAAGAVIASGRRQQEHTDAGGQAA